ncbi:hypothetical protein HDU78_002484 [Chytriomyces hyalinus]|nr:hypothetical protein HDU78_002484 [Chytriomyces hyalinus]
MEQRVIANISAARISLDAGIAECTTAENVFHAPQHPTAILNATKHLSTTLNSLSAANLTATRKCNESTSEPILDNPFYMFAMAHLHMGRILCLRSLFGDALSKHFEIGVQVFPYSARLFHALGNARKSVAKTIADLEQVEDAFKHAVRISKDLALKRDSFNEKLDEQKRDLEENDENDDDDDEDDDSWVLEASVDDEINAGRDAENALILLLIQLGRSSEAAPLLESGGYKYRLSDAVLAYSFTENSKGPWRLHDIPFVKAIDSALPDPALRYLQNAFAKDSVFWKEHYYGPDTPYFSYSHALPTPTEKDAHPRSSVDQLIHYVHKLVSKLLPQVSEAKSAEWWVHSRVHSAGHQLHFDSAHEGKSGATSGDNKTKRRRMGPVHPIASCVIYLSEGCGGPTMVTNQRLGDPLADRGWMVASRVNRLVVFDGSVLHGVIPGKGVCGDAGLDEGRRTSFMIAFWDHVDIKPSPDNTPGSGRPFPYNVSKDVYTWPQQHQPNTNEKWPGAVPDKLHHVIPVPLEAVWEAIGETGGAATEKESDAIQAILTEGDLELGYSKSRLGLPNYNLVFQGF